MSGSHVSLRSVSCSFRLDDGRMLEALRNINLDVPPGQFLCVVGRSGGGKSTLVRSIAGLTPLARGEITVDGRQVSGPGPDRGMVFQEDTVFPWKRVGENVAMSLRAQNVPAQQRKETVAKWLDAVGLADYSGAWPKELSGGMRKRVALATVFAAGSPVMIMDEPFGALDYVTRLTLHEVLLELWQKSGCTIVFVTHDIEEALVLGDRVIVVQHGQIADDMLLELPRPRQEEERASPRAVEVSKRIVRILHLEEKVC